MAQGWNSDAERDAMLRRVAIVLSSLPASVANQILGTMGMDSIAAVRRTMTTLADVDPLERQRALQAFRVSMQQQPAPVPSSAAPAVPNPAPAVSNLAPAVSNLAPGVPNAAIPAEPTARVMSSEGIHVQTERSTNQSGSPAASDVDAHLVSDSPLSFLSEIDDDTLFMLVSVEHPQAIAFVLASIAPVQAARIIPRLDDALRRATLSRLGRLGEVPEEAAAEVANHFRNRLQDRSRDGHLNTGRRALDAILAALPSENPSEQSTKPTTAEQSFASPSVSGSSLDFPSADRPAMNLSAKLRQAIDSDDDPQPNSNAAVIESDPVILPLRTHQQDVSEHAVNVDQALSANADSSESAPSVSMLHSTDSIHQHLITLSPMELCRALGKVDARDAMLALCGLPNDVTEAALANLRRPHAKKARAAMNRLGSVQLREIDEAKERVAHASLPTDVAA
ncbi:MAG: FliG C-terminal domain-containing protein [Planctomycetota bacterium]